MATIGEARAELQLGIDETTKELPLLDAGAKSAGTAAGHAVQAAGKGGEIAAQLAGATDRLSQVAVGAGQAREAVQTAAGAMAKIGTLLLSATAAVSGAAQSTGEVSRHITGAHDGISDCSSSLSQAVQHAETAHGHYTEATVGSAQPAALQLTGKSAAHIDQLQGLRGESDKYAQEIGTDWAHIGSVGDAAQELSERVAGRAAHAERISALLAQLSQELGEFTAEADTDSAAVSDIQGVYAGTDTLNTTAAGMARVHEHALLVSHTAQGVIDTAQAVQGAL